MKKNIHIPIVLAAMALLFPGSTAKADTAEYTTPGDYVWHCPADVSSVVVESWGGGGAGGGAKSTGNNARGGGGAGGSFARFTVGTTPDTDYNVHVGAGGVCLTGFVGNSAYPGDYSSFSNVDNTVCYVLASGGAGGKSVIANNNNGAGGVGATTGNIGNIFFAGGSGGTSGAAGSGGGGGGAGNASPGTNAAVATAGAGGTDGGGIGAAGRTAVNAGLSATVVAGGGGGGAWGNSATERLGGSGAGGKVVLTFTAGAVAPVIVASAATSVGTTTATLNGDVTSDGGSAILERGFVYKTSAGVTITDNKTLVAGTTGSYTLDLTTLGVNVNYFFRAYASNSVGTTLSTLEPSFWTLANVPVAPTVNGATVNSLNVTIGSDGNPGITTFAIHETILNQYVQTNGTLGATLVYQTAADWGSKTVTGLLSGTTYTFEVRAKNGGGVVTAFGTSANGATTGPATTKIQPETKADGSGIAVTDQNIIAGSSITVYAIARTAANAFVANVPATWSLPTKTDGVVDGDLTPTTGNSATFTGHLAGTATIRAAYGALTPTDSGTITVTAPLTFTTSDIWVCPPGVTSIKVECWGGGGAGGAAHNSSGTGNCRGGGGAGGSFASAYVAVTPGASYNVMVGAGGVSQSGFVANTAYPGDSSSFSNVDNTVGYVLAGGGAGGKSVVANNINGAGGVGAVVGNLGDVVLSGGSGGTGGGAASGAGGGGAGNSTPGGSAPNNNATPGVGGVAGGGDGAAGRTAANTGIDATVVAGGGGGGAWANSSSEILGGAGAAGKVVLTFAPVLVWQGDGGGNQWNTSSPNWTNSAGASSTFTNGAAVVFDDSSANHTVNLVGALSPLAMTVNASAVCTFSGGTILGQPGLVKSGSGILDLGANNRAFGAVVIAGGTVTNGTLTGSSFGGQSGAVSAVLAGPGAGLTKGTSGLLTLSGANTYTGNTTITAGTLSILGSLGNGTVNVNGGGLGGTGTIAGPVAVGSGGSLAPGVGAGPVNGLGTLTVNSNLTLQGIAVMQLNRTNTPANDRVAGIATLTAGGTLTVTNTGDPLHAGDSFTLFTAGTYSGAFTETNLPTLNSGLDWDTSLLGTSGTISVISTNSIVTDPPPTLTNSVAAGQLQLNWGTEYAGYTLQMQTNTLGKGLGTNWQSIPGSETMTSTNIQIDPAVPTTFYRLLYTP